jgi:hypothetical protein
MSGADSKNTEPPIVKPDDVAKRIVTPFVPDPPPGNQLKRRSRDGPNPS